MGKPQENSKQDFAGHSVSIKSNKFGYRSAEDGSHPSGLYRRPASVTIVADHNKSMLNVN